MKVGLVKDEMWPCYIMVLDWTSAEKTVNVTEEFYQEYRRIGILFGDMQDKLETLFEDVATFI